MEPYEQLAQHAKDYSRAVTMAGKWQQRVADINAQMRELSEKIVKDRFPVGESTVFVGAAEPSPESDTETKQEQESA